MCAQTNRLFLSFFVLIAFLQTVLRSHAACCRRSSTCTPLIFVCYRVRVSSPIILPFALSVLLSFSLVLLTSLLHFTVDQPVLVEGVTVTAMDANHCPGALLLLFELPDGRRILHTGDMRWDECMKSYAAIAGRPIDELYLDTTFCDPRYDNEMHFLCRVLLDFLSVTVYILALVS